MKNIILIGMMGCGKSTCGKLLARALEMDFLDTDKAIEDKAGCSIPEIFEKRGEAAFRRMELEMAWSVAGRGDLVVACGGGLPLQAEAISPLKAGGAVVYLERDPEEIFDQVSMEGRPLGQGTKREFAMRALQRDPVYRQWADLVVPSQATPEETVELAIRRMYGEGIL